MPWTSEAVVSCAVLWDNKPSPTGSGYLQLEDPSISANLFFKPYMQCPFSNTPNSDLITLIFVTQSFCSPKNDSKLPLYFKTYFVQILICLPMTCAPSTHPFCCQDANCFKCPSPWDAVLCRKDIWFGLSRVRDKNSFL